MPVPSVIDDEKPSKQTQLRACRTTTRHQHHHTTPHHTTTNRVKPPLLPNGREHPYACVDKSPQRDPQHGAPPAARLRHKAVCGESHDSVDHVNGEALNIIL